MCARLLLSVMIFFAGFCPGYTYSTNRIHYHYRELVNNKVIDIELALEETGDTCRLTCKSRDEISVSIDDKSLSTLEWFFTKPSEKSDIKVKREGNFLFIDGTFKGKGIHDRMPIDERPWYQATSLSLKDFVFSTDQERTFWVLLSDSLSPVKFRAVKEATKSIKIGNASYDAIRIVMRPAGLKTLLWKGEYWFNLEEGILLRFQGPTGLPGSAMSEIIIVSVVEDAE